MNTDQYSRNPPRIEVILPAKVDAFGIVPLRFRVMTEPEYDLEGVSLSLRDDKDKLIADEILLAEVADDPGVFASAEIEIDAPEVPGEYGWRVSLPEFEVDGEVYPETVSQFTLSVVPATLEILIWDLPPVVQANDRFEFRVGVKSSNGRPMGGRRFQLTDADGNPIASGCLDNQVWPETKGLYAGKACMKAPEPDGRHEFQVRFDPEDSDPATGGATRDFAVRVVPEPDCSVRVRVRDRKSGKPTSGLHVLMHPYRAFTAENGEAMLRVTAGTYTLHVSGKSYLPFRTELNVDGGDEALVVQADLEIEPPYEHL